MLLERLGDGQKLEPFAGDELDAVRAHLRSVAARAQKPDAPK